MKNWRVKFRNFLDRFSVHYEALFINKTINNNCMTLLMTFHDTHDVFWSFISGTLPTLNLLIKRHLHQGGCLLPNVILVSNYHFYKEITIKLLPYHSFYGCDITPRKLSPLFCQFVSKKERKTKPLGSSFSSISLTNFKKSVMTFTTFHIKTVWLLFLLCRI